MTTFVESLKRLYTKGRTSKAKIDQLLADGKITQEEHDYILA